MSPFVGREDERRLLRGRFDVARDGDGQVVLLVGEAGIGKSRLMRALRDELPRSAHTWLETGASPYFANTPFFAVTEMIRRALAWKPDTGPEARIAILENAIANSGLRTREAIPLVAPLLDLPVPAGYPQVLGSPELLHRRLLDLLVEWVLGTARRDPLVLLCEDLQWADPSTLGVLEGLAVRGARVPLLLLLTARPEFRVPWALQPHHTNLTLTRLARKQARELVARVAHATLPSEAMDLIVARTDGVPLFVEELTRTVLEAFMAALQGVPTALEDSLLQRLDRLGSAAKGLAQAAAVLGREFSEDLLRQLLKADETLGLDDDAAYDAAVHALVGAGLCYVHDAAPDRTYRFKHELVREAAHRSLSAELRRTLHRRVATLLEQPCATKTAPQPELLAHHWAESGEIARAVEAWREAAEHAQRRGAFGETARHVEEALALLPAMPETPERDQQELQLLLLLGTAFMIVKGYGSAEAAAAVTRARELGERMTDPATLILLLMGQWVVLMTRDGPRVAQLVAEQLVAAAARSGLPDAEVAAHFAQGATRYQLGDFAGARETLAKALALSESGDSTPAFMPLDLRVGVLAYASHAAWHQGLADEARALARQMLERAERRGPGERAFAEQFAAALYMYVKDARMALRCAQRTLVACTQESNAVHEGVAVLYSGCVLADDGHVEEGIRLARDGFDRFIASGQRVGLPAFAGFLSEAYARAGDYAEALAALAMADEAMPGDEVDLADTLRRRADLLAATNGNAAEVEGVYRDALHVARARRDKAYELRAAVAMGRWLSARGRGAEARQELAPVYASFTEGFDTRDLQDARLLLQQLAEADSPAA